MSVSPRLLFLLSLPPALWAGNVVFARLVIGDIDPLWLNALRWVLALALLLPLGHRVVLDRGRRQAWLAHWRYFIIVGPLGIGAFNGLQYLALRTSTPLNVTLIAASLPLWMMAVGVFPFRSLPRRPEVAGALLSLVGVAVVLSRGDIGALVAIHFVEGDLLMILAVIGWAFYSWLLIRPPAALAPQGRLPWTWAESLLVQCVFGVPLALAAATGASAAGLTTPLVPSVGLALVLVFVAVGPSILAYRAWGMAVATAGPGLAALFYNFTPLLAGAMSAVLINEWPKPYHGVALALLIGGVLISMRGRR
ncbi:DMT family transporter [Zavarzinia compransoris]|uniref:EamA family transporter n=1 Tax=Zavarzinia compransoris TaxID=1264899 RepID=A0A317E1M8_9PROT|nr:DMT family transporter [Zavarzinia compransoris]PWR20036.1 EamA family transporter [Zavarzinia compransoris]TDP44843.1 EamA-like transporter family protein [Zavarzinia compransoris]